MLKSFKQSGNNSNILCLGLLSLFLGVLCRPVLADTLTNEQQIEGSEQANELPDNTLSNLSNGDGLLDLSTSAETLLKQQNNSELIEQQNSYVNFQGKIAQIDQQNNSVFTSVEPGNSIEELRGNSLANRHPFLSTAHQLRSGEIIPIFRYRQQFPPEDVISGLAGQPTLGASWGVNDNLELTLDIQTVDNEGPGRQGPFVARRTPGAGFGSGNFFQEITLEAKQRLWQNPEGNQALSAVFGISRGVRSYSFLTPGGRVPGPRNTRELVPSIELPFTLSTGDRWQFTVSPKVAFLPQGNALYFRTLPTENPGSFGATLGLAGGAMYRVNQRLSLWGDAFVPFSGNNTINRDTGFPARTIAYNAGLRYLVSPRLATDLFVSNTLGNTGALSVIADREYPFLGFSVNFIPGITAANRRYPTAFTATEQPTPPTPAGFAFFDGGTIPAGQLLTTVQGSGQGILAAIRYGILDDLEIGTFIDFVRGTTDESQLGFSGKIRFLNQASGDPLTVSALLTAARSNNVLVNFLTNNANQFQERGLTRGGFAFSNEDEGELFIVTASLPLHYQLNNGSALWLTPTLGFIQRNGLQIAGLTVGSSTPIGNNLNLIGEVGVNLHGLGNAFVGRTRENVIPFSVGLRWNPTWQAIPGLELETYLTNRLGSSPYHALRVQANNDVSVGVGVRLPIQF